MRSRSNNGGGVQHGSHRVHSNDLVTPPFDVMKMKLMIRKFDKLK